MSTAEMAYLRYQRLYEELKTGPLFAETPFLQGALRYVPAPTDEESHHLLNGCGQVAADAETVEVSAEDVDWDRVCDDCAEHYITPDNYYLWRASEVFLPFVEAVKAAGGTVEGEETPFTAVENFFKSENFPIPEPEHPKDLEQFWEAYDELSSPSASLYDDISERWFGQDWSRRLYEIKSEATKRWSAGPLFKKLREYHSTRRTLLAELEHRSWALNDHFSKMRAPVVAWPDLQLAADALKGRGLALSHLEDLQLNDFPDVSSYLSAVNERLLLVARQALDVPETEELRGRPRGFHVRISRMSDALFGQR